MINDNNNDLLTEYEEKNPKISTSVLLLTPYICAVLSQRASCKNLYVNSDII